MGITRELVRNVFSKSRSIQRHDQSHGHQASVERKRWSNSVRSYLCGDEHNSIFSADQDSFRSSTIAEVDLDSFRVTNITSVNHADEDTASVRSSEATVNQPLISKDEENEILEKENSTYKLFKQEDAALIIQSAFRSFRARRAQYEATMHDDEKHELTASPSRESIGASIEVQTGNSSDIFSIKEESFDLRHMRHRTKAQVLKIQEDWDDSTVSSVIAKMRTQNKLEAATRRERALAYAFSQQLRICAKKKQSIETNTGWSWLERWMAARQPEITLIEDTQKALVRKRSLMMDEYASAMEEKESCGSNEVSSLVEVGISISSAPKHVPRPPKTRYKPTTTNFSTQNSAASSHLCPRESKDVKKACNIEDEKDKRKGGKQPGNKRDTKNATTQVLLDHEIQQ